MRAVSRTAMSSGRRLRTRFETENFELKGADAIMDWKMRLFECIRAGMEKGSPEGYDAETGFAEPAQKPQAGEPNERQSLYRIRCPQEKRQLLREDRRRPDCRRRQATSYSPGAAPMGAATHRTVARRHVGDAVQRLDLRCVESICGRVADGASGHDESHRGIQEKERPAGRTQDRRSGALQFAAGVLRSAGGDSGTAAVAARPPRGGGGGGGRGEKEYAP